MGSTEWPQTPPDPAPSSPADPESQRQPVMLLLVINGFAPNLGCCPHGPLLVPQSRLPDRSFLQTNRNRPSRTSWALAVTPTTVPERRKEPTVALTFLCQPPLSGHMGNQELQFGFGLGGPESNHAQSLLLTQLRDLTTCCAVVQPMSPHAGHFANATVCLSCPKCGF